MLRISQEQMEAFTGKARANFIQRMVTHLMTNFAHEIEKLGLHEADLACTVEQTIDVAAAYGVRNEQDVELFLDCMMMLGLDFHRAPRFPWAGSLLQRHDLTGTEKMALIHNYLLFTPVKADR